MEDNKEKKGLFSRLTGGGAKPKKNPCCGGFVIEEVPEGKKENEKEPRSPEDKKGSCCG